MTIKSILGMGFALLLPIGQANALLLENWNDTDLDVSGDSIVVNTGTTTGDDTWFSLQWQAGSGNTLTALGIDKIFYSCDCDIEGGIGLVEGVYEGSLFGTDVTDDWKTNYGGETSGGGFGDFISLKSNDPGGNGGIDPNILFFVLSGDFSFVSNGDPTNSTFAAHVRYEDDCSGWVSDGNTSSPSSGSCGTSVPEPSILWLLGSGLVLIGFARRKA